MIERNESQAARCCLTTRFVDGWKAAMAAAIYADKLEKEIDQMNLSIEPIKSFVLPGGSKVSSQLHLCRTTCRRAERYVVELTEKEKVNPEILKYLNRLSDWFFVSARKFNNNGKNDILWIPSKN